MEDRAKRSFLTDKRFFLWSLCWAGLLVFATLHFWVIWKYAIDIPYLDEWELFRPGGIGQGWSADFIFSFFLDHRIVLTKIVYLLNQNFFDLNFRYQILLTVFFHAGLAFTVWKMIGKEVGEGRSLLALLAFLPFISTLPFESHTRALMIGKVLTLWCFLGGAYFFVKKESWPYFALGTFLWVIAFLGGGSGLAGVIAGSAALLLWNLLLQDKKGFLKSIALFFFFAGAAYFWSQGYQRDPVHPALTPPWDFKFFRFLSESVSLGFGFTDLNPYLSMLCFYLVLMALVSAAFVTLRNRQNVSMSRQAGFLMTMTLGILGMASLAAVGRAGLSLWQAKFSRYAEVTMLLPILSVAMFDLIPKLKLAVFWVVLLLTAGLWDNFDLSVYKTVGNLRKEGAACVQALLLEPGANPSGICPQLYPHSLLGPLETARSLGIHFTRSVPK